MVTKRIFSLCLTAFLGFGLSQTLAEVSLVAAISAELNPGISLPSGSFRAIGEGTAPIIAQVPDANNFTDWEVYSAGGIAMNLQPAFVQQISTSFAVNGYFLSEQTEREVGDAVHTHYLFDDGAGGTTLLYTIRSPQDLIYLIAKGL